MHPHHLPRLALVWIAVLLLAGCAINSPHRYSGHWVEGVPYSLFIDSRDHRTYLLYDPLPKEVEDFLKDQHHYLVPNSESGEETAIQLVIEAYPELEKTFDPDGTPAGTELHVTKVISYGPADPAFIEKRKNGAQ